MTKRLRIALLALGLCGMVLVFAFLVHPDSERVASVRYWAWKHNLAKMDLDRALDEMVTDPGRDSMVIGRTRRELDTEFGFIIPIEQASPYVQFCYRNSQYSTSQAVILRRSNWMVLMQNDKARKLIRVSGC